MVQAMNDGREGLFDPWVTRPGTTPLIVRHATPSSRLSLRSTRFQRAAALTTARTCQQPVITCCPEVWRLDIDAQHTGGKS